MFYILFLGNYSKTKSYLKVVSFFSFEVFITTDFLFVLYNKM